MRFDNNYVRIDLDAVEANVDAVREKAGTDLMAVIKADAYGHGAVEIARLLRDKCAFFGVSSVPEAVELRQAGLDNPILILGYTPVSAFPILVGMDIRPAIFHEEDALALSREALHQGKTAPFHFAVDTGMSRIGFQVTDADADLCAEIARLPGLRAEGIFSHFATADCRDLSRAQTQAAQFDRFCQMLLSRGVRIPIRHLNNSAGLMNFDTHYEMVRSGIVTYGMYPSREVDPARLPIRPALEWLSQITHLKTLPAGREIGYGGTFTTVRETRVATVPVGYADGYSRSLSNRFHVLIQGHRAKILGKVCMDQIMVDVTQIPGAQTGSPVVLVGRSGDEEITMEQISDAAGSFNYEFSCGISRRVPRVYIRAGKPDRTVRYLLDARPGFEGGSL